MSKVYNSLSISITNTFFMKKILPDKPVIVKSLTIFLCLFLFANPSNSQKAIIMLRHAERVAYDNSDNDLSEAGHQRAKSLSNMLKDAGVTAIYTSGRKRAIQTAEPLASILKIETIPVPGSDSVYSQNMLKHLAGHSKEDVVLIIGHINTFIPLLRTMGYKEEIKMGDYEHDDLFIVFPKDAGAPTVLRINY